MSFVKKIVKVKKEVLAKQGEQVCLKSTQKKAK